LHQVGTSSLLTHTHVSCM